MAISADKILAENEVKSDTTAYMIKLLEQIEINTRKPE